MSIAPRSPSAHRRWGDDVGDANILHVDMDSFYAAVEVAENPSLEGAPLIVGGTSGRGVVTSCTYDLRALGVRAGMPMGQAKSLAPKALVVPGNRALYSAYSKRVMNILGTVTPDFEPTSIDEAYLDVSGSRKRLGLPTDIARRIRGLIRSELHLPASVGIGENKTVAKIASSHAKPDGVLLVPAAKTVEFLHELPVGSLPGVGPKAETRLNDWNIYTVKQLAETSFTQLARLLGDSHAHELLQRAAGNDRRQVAPRPQEKSISTERTFPRNLTDRAEVERYLLEASHDCARRLRAAGLVAWTVQIKLRDASFRTITRAQTLAVPTDLGRDIFDASRTLFAGQRLASGGVRLVGVGVSGLQSRQGGVPVSLDDDRRGSATEQAMDRVRSKYGKVSLQPASLLNPKRSDNP